MHERVQTKTSSAAIAGLTNIGDTNTVETTSNR
jgi:hypothetical protein